MPTRGKVTRRFTRDAYDRFKLVKDKLLANGAVEADIVLRLDAVVTEAALEDGDAAVKFFDCVLLCEVTREADRVLVRIVMTEEASTAV